MQINELQNELEMTRNRNQECEAENEVLETQVQDLTRRIKVLKSLESEYEQLRLEVEELRMQSKESNALRARIQELESTLSERGDEENGEMSDLKKKLGLAEEKMAEAEAIAESARKAAEKMERDATSRLVAAEKDKVAAEKRASISEKSLEQMERENERRNKAFMELQDKFKESEKHLVEKVEQAEGKAKESMVTIKTLEEQLLTLENKYSSIDSIEMEANRLREQEKELQARIVSLEKELEHMATRNAALESREEEINVQLALANQAIQAHNESADEMNREMAKLQAEKQSHLEEMASLKKSKHKEEHTRDLEKIVELEKTVDNLNKQIKDNASQKLRNVDLEKQNKELRWQIKMLGMSVANKPGTEDKAEQGGSLAKPMAPTTKSQPARISIARIFGAILSQKRNIVIFYIVILHCLVYYLSTRCAS